MQAFRPLALAMLLGCLPVLGACSSDQSDSAQSSSGGLAGTIDNTVATALDEAQTKLRSEPLTVSHNDPTLPKAEITPQGDLLVEGKAVDVTPVQRQQLLAYRGQIIGIAEAGMAIGAQGANIAGHALSGAVGAIFGGKDGEKEFEKKIEAEAAKIEAEAMKICTRLPGLMAGQQALAASLPEFKPYARMTQEDIDDCGKDVGKGKGVAISSGA